METIDIVAPRNRLEVWTQKIVVADISQRAGNSSKALDRRRIAVRVDEPQQLNG